MEEWWQGLNASTQQALQDDLDKLHKHAEHEFYYAGLDGHKELRERQQEYARKERHLLAKYRKLAMSANSTAEPSASDAFKLFASTTAALPNYTALFGAFMFGVAIAAAVTMRVFGRRPEHMQVPLLAHV